MQTIILVILIIVIKFVITTLACWGSFYILDHNKERKLAAAAILALVYLWISILSVMIFGNVFGPIIAATANLIVTVWLLRYNLFSAFIFTLGVSLINFILTLLLQKI